MDAVERARPATKMMTRGMRITARV